MKSKELQILEDERRDAESPNRDKVDGIGTLRSWLRAIHVKFVIGWDEAQDMSQDEIAQKLGEYPRGHSRQFRMKEKDR